MVVSFGKLFFEVNDYTLGAPFEDTNLASKEIFPLIVLEDKGDRLKVLPGFN